MNPSDIDGPNLDDRIHQTLRMEHAAIEARRQNHRLAHDTSGDIGYRAMDSRPRIAMGLAGCLLVALIAIGGWVAVGRNQQPTSIDVAAPATTAEPTATDAAPSAGTDPAVDPAEADPEPTAEVPSSEVRSMPVHYGVEPASFEDFTLVQPFVRSVTDDEQLVERWVSIWMAGPTDAEAASGALHPTASFRRGEDCDADFHVAQRADPLIVTLCGTLPSAGVGADARLLSSFNATMTELPGVELAALLINSRCLGVGGEDSLPCLEADGSDLSGTAPEPLAVPAITPQPGQCPAGAQPSTEAKYRVINVTSDDPDGGLIRHTGPGVDAPTAGVLEWNEYRIAATGACSLTPDGGTWWQVETFGQRPLWVNSAFLAVDERPESLCDSGALIGNDPIASPAGAPGDHDRIGAIDVDTSDPRCAVVTITMANADGPATQLAPDLLVDFGHRPGVLRVAVTSGFDHNPQVPAQQLFWGSQPRRAVVVTSTGATIRTGTEAAAAVEFTQTPAAIRIGIPSFGAPLETQLARTEGGSPAFVLDPVRQIAAGSAIVKGHGLGFEAIATATVVSADGEPFDATFTNNLSDGANPTEPITGRLSFSTGNPGVAWGEFEFTVSRLPPGEYLLVLDGCDQCAPVPWQSGLPFVIE